MALILVPFTERMKFGLSSVVSSAGIFRRLKPTKANGFSVFHYLCSPTLRLAVPANPCVARLVTAPHPSILEIFRNRNISQIFDGIICFVPVYMVDAPNRKNAVHVKPSKPMDGVKFVVNSNDNVSSVLFATGHATSFCIPYSNPPSKFPGIFVVVEKFFKSGCCKIVATHAVAPVKRWFGKNPTSVSAPVGFAILAAEEALALLEPMVWP